MANLINLGIAGMRPAAGAASGSSKPAEPAMNVEMGTSGTGIFGRGYIRELGEYNPDFSGGPFTSYRTFEKMRRGDAQVAATIMAMKLPVRCAEWMIEPPEDATPAEKECAEFVETCLFDDTDFDRTLENLLLALDFGAACHEDIWTATNGEIRLKKLAPRLPLTFYTWTIDDNEELLALIQHGFHRGSFTEFTLPADKIALFTFRREGSNFAGRAILREMYQHWYTKAALYKIDAIAAERNGMGVPVGTLGPDAKQEDRKTFQTFLAQLSAHQSAYLMQPEGYKFELVGVTGQLRSAWESIQHHNMQISMAGLAQFMIMGQQSKGSGNRSLGETMSSFFYLSLQSLADQLGGCISNSTIARLAAYNYGPKVRPPKLVPQQILALAFESVTDALQKLGTARMLTPDPDMELWLRKKMGAPAVDRTELVRLRAAVTTSGPPENPGSQGAEPGQGADGEGTGKGEGAAADGGSQEAENEDLGADSGQGGEAPGIQAAMNSNEATDGADGGGVSGESAAPDFSGVPLRREPRGVEGFLALADIVNELDRGRDGVAAALRAARSRVQAEIVNKLVNTPVRNMHRVSIAPDQALTQQVEEILRGVAEFGAQQVADERARQLAGRGVESAAKIRASVRDAIGLYADAIVSKFENGITARAANLALDWLKRPAGQTKGEAIRGIEADMDDQSDKWIDSVASEGANSAFADGRQDGYEQHADEIGSVIYSALLDVNTCPACAEADGAEGATPDDIPAVPNPDCDGGDKCRCVHVFVFSDEGGKA